LSAAVGWESVARAPGRLAGMRADQAAAKPNAARCPSRHT